ncbi:hypothetical protein AB0F13_22495 [Streptomyces sp. NPDC026206]|uniref:hypothetical protein n=1 Tax=Streptomyces sp. NPDC026206 TaxID=3157089 RepID=UPI0033DE27FE
MVTRKTTRRKPSSEPCPDCTAGQVSEAFKVGGRKKLESPDRQQAICLTCLGSGEVPATD